MIKLHSNPRPPRNYTKDTTLTPNRNTETKQRDFLEALVKNKGLIHKSCMQTGIRYSTYRTWMKKDRFKLKMDEAQQQVFEQVEASLMAKFNSTSPMGEIFYLKSRDKRYHQQSIVLEGNEDKPIVVTHDPKALEKISKTIIKQLKAQ